MPALTSPEARNKTHVHSGVGSCITVYLSKTETLGSSEGSFSRPSGDVTSRVPADIVLARARYRGNPKRRVRSATVEFVVDLVVSAQSNDEAFWDPKGRVDLFEPNTRYEFVEV
jgi:hypothetical protein